MASFSVTTTAAASGQSLPPTGALVCTPDEIEFLLVVRQLSPRDRDRLDRVMQAQVEGRLPYSPEQMDVWTPDEFRAAADALPALGEARA